MDIRLANENDAEGISETYEEWSKLRDVLPDMLVESMAKIEILKELSNENKKYLVAVAGDEIAGVCYIDMSFMGLQNLRLGNMIVKEKYRRQKVASGLISKVKEFAVENNVRKIWLWTQEELSPALRFYERNGFKLEGRQNSQFCGKDALLYGLILK